MTGSDLFPLLYRDDRLVAVAKPSGMAVHRGWSRDRIVALTAVRDRLGRTVYPIHRLDRATSGALLFALDPATARAVQEQFAAGTVRKRYLALVRGIPPEHGVIDHPVPRSPHGPRVPAVTAYRRLATFERYALLEAVPRTGRLHQIRRHLKHLSHPLIGDVRYGKGEHNRLFRERFHLHRLALHALELALDHPTDGRRLCLFAPVPEDLAGPLRAMGMEVPGPAPAALHAQAFPDTLSTS
jgi:tRNA pseudouridine65 synthase